jgi:hypothetical protein
MLGFESLEQKLREGNGKRAKATVLQAKDGIHTTMNGDSHGYGGTDITRWHYLLRVEPDGEPPFEAKVVIRINKLDGAAPHEGESVLVLYDPDDHDKVAFAVAETKEQRVSAWQSRLQGLQLTPAASPPPPDPIHDQIDQLQKLADLHDRGALTDAEFQAEKAKLLSS